MPVREMMVFKTLDTWETHNNKYTIRTVALDMLL